LGYAWLFWLPAIVATGIIVAVRLVVPASPVRMPGRVGWAAPVLLSAWLVALLFGVSKAPEWGWGSAKVLGLMVIAVVLAIAWVRVELRSDTPLIDMRMMRLRAVWTGNAVMLLVGVAMFAGFAFIPQFVQTHPGHGYGFDASITESGLIMLPVAVGAFLSGMAAGPLARRFATRWLLLSGCLVAVAAFVVLALLLDQRWEILLAVALLGWGTGLVFAVMPTVIIGAVPAEQTGVATGMNNNIRTIGGAIGAAVMSTIVTSSAGPDGIPTEAGYSWGFAMIALTVSLAALACLLIPNTRRLARPLDPATEGTPLEYAELAMTAATPAQPHAASPARPHRAWPDV
jgi:predicted MFS family arabinose efflux permease